MKTQKEFIETVMDGKILKCGTTKIYYDGRKIYVNGEGFATLGYTLKSSKVETFVHLMDSFGSSVIAFHVEDWVIA